MKSPLYQSNKIFHVKILQNFAQKNAFNAGIDVFFFHLPTFLLIRQCGNHHEEEDLAIFGYK
jgi:hypothetical protein